MPLIPCKYAPPLAPPRWLRRPLIEGGAPLPAGVMLVAGPGYGKTLTLAALAQQADGIGKLVVWYAADAWDAEPGAFFQGLLLAMRTQIPGFAPELDALAAAGRDDDRRLWRLFFEAVSACGADGACLAIDDAHLLPGAVVQALMSFLDKLPVGTHVLMASRTRLPVSLARLMASGYVKVFTQDALRFDQDETWDFLRQHAPAGRVPPEWASRAAQLAGWPLGLAQIVLVPHPSDEVLLDELEPDERLDHLARTLIDAQPEARRAFMLRAALLQELTPEACRAAFGAVDGNAHLAALVADQIAYRLAYGDGYRFPPYLDALLRRLALAEVGAEERRACHRRAAAFFADKGFLAYALAHALDGEDWASAVRLADVYFQKARRGHGRQALIARWLARFPSEWLDTEPTLLQWRGASVYGPGRLAEARAFYERALAGFERARDHQEVFHMRVRLAELAVVRGDMACCERLVAQAREQESAAHVRDLAALHVLLAAMAARRDDDARIRAHCRDALEVPVGENGAGAALHCIALINLYYREVLDGAYARALAHVEAGARLAEAWNLFPYRVQFAFCRLELCLARRDLRAASACLRAVPSIWPEVTEWAIFADGQRILADFHRAGGDHRRAEEALARAWESYERAGFDVGKKQVARSWCWLEIARARPERVPELLSRSGAVLEGDVHDRALFLPLARAAHLAGDPAGAVAIAGGVLPRLEAEQHRFEALLVMAAAQAALGDPAAADGAARQAAALASARDEGFFTPGDPGLLAELGPVFARLGLAPDQLLTGAREAEHPAPTAPHALYVRCLGGFDVQVGRTQVTRWPRRKARWLLAALLLHPEGLSPDELAVLRGEPVTPGTPNAWQVVVSALRRTLEPGASTSVRSCQVRYEDGRYQLDWTQVASFDLAAFEGALEEAERLREAPPEAAAQYARALSCYEGAPFEGSELDGAFPAVASRARVRALEACLWLAGFHEAQGDATAVEAMLCRAVAIAPHDERAVLARLRHAAARGERERVRQVYWDFRKALKAAGFPAPGAAFEASYRALLEG